MKSFNCIDKNPFPKKVTFIGIKCEGIGTDLCLFDLLWWKLKGDFPSTIMDLIEQTRFIIILSVTDTKKSEYED